MLVLVLVLVFYLGSTQYFLPDGVLVGSDAMTREVRGSTTLWNLEEGRSDAFGDTGERGCV